MTEHNGGESGFGSDAVPNDARTPENDAAQTHAAPTAAAEGSAAAHRTPDGTPDGGAGADAGPDVRRSEGQAGYGQHESGQPGFGQHAQASFDAPVPPGTPPTYPAGSPSSPRPAQSSAEDTQDYPFQNYPTQQYSTQQYPTQQYPTRQYPSQQYPATPAETTYGATPYPSSQPQSGSAVYGGAGQAPVRRREKRKVGAGIFVAGMVAAALVGGGTAAGTSALLGSQTPTGSSSQAAPNVPLIVNNTNDVNAVTAAAQKASPSVVTISAVSGNSGGTGSGIILDTDGHILTNTHVVTLDGAAASATLEVRTNDGKVYSGKVVGTDPLSDLAVIKIDAPGLVPAALGDSSKINVGETVIAIGAPLGLSGTVTDGIISTLNRTIQVASSAVPKSQSDSSSGNGDSNGGNGFNFAPPDGSNGSNAAATGTVNLNVIQTDAAINPGNSGGALTNSKGEIIGVNVAIASAGASSGSSGQSGNIGVGFSIPINTAKRISQEIIDNGTATHGQLGVSVKGSAAGQSGNGTFSNGAVVASVVSGSAADKAGFKAGDIITNFGTRSIDDASALTAAVREQAAGATVKATFLRDGKQQSVDVTLDSAS
ncbi:trypsin-like peptidase domain-containing protein [Paeniglutamicibacter antarcticus]|uniref:Trypsin-like peptidase domain-containing protein n=1 Tax=Arthrobacter terrae TaxID=2935737 RepID=A0A931CIZ8_9MICC|nr:trypsin-like peptidase domain-containing protein [Arthrobacter terrae]MBG0739477.1 trypsin-like peptidase domain-containing protein [Arthrobacter terrae]